MTFRKTATTVLTLSALAWASSASAQTIVDTANGINSGTVPAGVFSVTVVVRGGGGGGGG